MIKNRLKLGFLEVFRRFVEKFLYEATKLVLQAYQGYFRVCVKYGPPGGYFGGTRRKKMGACFP